MMEAFFDLGDRYASESGWEDFALTKICLFSMGLAAGMQVPDKYRKVALGAAAVGFAATYVPLMAKVFRIAAGTRH